MVPSFLHLSSVGSEKDAFTYFTDGIFLTWNLALLLKVETLRYEVSYN
jgi:hypothetical protein